MCVTASLPHSPHATPGAPGCAREALRAGLPAAAVLTRTLEEVAVDVLDGGIDSGPGGDTSRSDIGVVLGVYILKSFPWNSRMEF